MRMKLAVPIVAIVTLLGLSCSALAEGPATTAGSGWKQLLRLRPGETKAQLTVPMTAADCAAARAANLRASASECFTHVVVKKVNSPTIDMSGRFVLASCGRLTYEGSMWNLLWWSDVTLTFCWSSTYVYVTHADCSNWGAYPGETLTVTWCGAGSAGSIGNGGDNVTLRSYVGTVETGSYGAGQRGNINTGGAIWWSCWNAHC